MMNEQKQKVFYDQMYHPVSLLWPPKRIISLVPSQTELLAYFGLNKEIAGITKFCIHPDQWHRTKQRVGGTKNLNIIAIDNLNPDLIIGNKEENKEEQIKLLMQRYPVWMSDIHNLNDALWMITNVGKLVNKSVESYELCNHIRSNFRELKKQKPIAQRVAYFIWKKPYMSVNKHTFINHILELCNFENVFKKAADNYPQVSAQDIKKARPDIILLSSEPYPFAEKHIIEFKEICPESKVLLVNGEYFSWYGPRLLNTPKYITELMKRIANV